MNKNLISNILDVMYWISVIIFFTNEEVLKKLKSYNIFRICYIILGIVQLFCLITYYLGYYEFINQQKISFLCIMVLAFCLFYVKHEKEDN